MCIFVGKAFSVATLIVNIGVDVVSNNRVLSINGLTLFVPISKESGSSSVQPLARKTRAERKDREGFDGFVVSIKIFLAVGTFGSLAFLGCSGERLVGVCVVRVWAARIFVNSYIRR